MMKKRYANIELLRILGCIAVITHHLVQQGAERFGGGLHGILLDQRHPVCRAVLFDDHRLDMAG